MPRVIARFPSLLASALLAAFLAQPAAAVEQSIPVGVLDRAPTIDGDLGEWGTQGWQMVAIKPSLLPADRPKYGLAVENDRNQTGVLTLQVKAGVFAGRFYLAVKYPDSSEDREHRVWLRRGDAYAEGREREDMFAVRFHMAGDFDRSMLGNREYRADVWLWSAARTDPAGIAEDMTHYFTTRLLDSAAEYALPDGKTVYIQKRRDAGDAPYRMLPRPREQKGERIASFVTATPSGSAADVAAKGRWRAGHWQLEFSRALNTGNDDDVVFMPGQKLIGQLAVFNKGYSEHKSVSEPLLFDFPRLP